VTRAVAGREIGGALELGSVVTPRFPSGRRTLRIDAIHPTQDGRYVVCAPGCLFTEAGT
jgi:hypothetical protein